MTREELEEMLAKMDNVPTPKEDEKKEEKEEEKVEKKEETTNVIDNELLAKTLTKMEELVNENKELKEALNKHFKTSPTSPDKIEKPITTIEPDVKTIATEFVNREGSFVNRYLKEHGIEKEK